MTPDDEDRVTGQAVKFLAESLLEVGGKVEALPGRLAELEQRERDRDAADEIRRKEEKKQEKRRRRVIHQLTAAVAVLALLSVGTVAVFVFLFHQQDVRFHQQDVSRAHARAARDAQIARLDQKLTATQGQNTVFRQRICLTLGDWRVYLANAPAGPAAGQEAARRLIADLATLCPK